MRKYPKQTKIIIYRSSSRKLLQLVVLIIAPAINFVLVLVIPYYEYDSQLNSREPPPPAVKEYLV